MQEKSASEGERVHVEATFPSAQAVALADWVTVMPGSVVSRIVVKNRGGNVTVFAFDEGQGLSEHTAPFDALVVTLAGTAALTIGGAEVQATAGSAVLMPANVPHAVRATSPFKMMLVMVREPK